MIDQYLVSKLDAHHQILLREALRNPIWDVMLSLKLGEFIERRQQLRPDPNDKTKIYDEVLAINREEALVGQFREMRKWLLEQEITGHEGEDSDG